ncbi:MAG: hypothetical protein ACYDGN_13930 [Acidimicrobiales bacterium]
MIGQSFEGYMRLFRQMAPIPCILILPAYLASLAIGLIVWRPHLHDFRSAVGTNGLQTLRYYGAPGRLTVPIVVSALLLLILLVLQIVTNAAIVAVVGQGYVGSTPSWRSGISSAFHRSGSIIWSSFLVLLVSVAGLAVATIVAALLTVAHLVPLTVIVFAAMFVGLVYLFVSLSVMVPVIVLGRPRGWAAVRRSFVLVRRRFWPTFGILFVITLIVWLAWILLQTFISLSALLGPGGYVVGVAFTGIGGLLISSLIPVATAFNYFDLQNRAEGIDVSDVAERLGVQPGRAPSPYPPPGYPPAGYPPAGYPPTSSGPASWQQSNPSPWTATESPPVVPPKPPPAQPSAPAWPALSPKPSAPHTPRNPPPEPEPEQSP